ncbi:carbon-nitrogen hydrolase [Gilbertella persicaria]|uniref:CN hydrolase domain-containing protein n=1 Tax=Rhizopus stolonifer TaxID=4846 RepID=A0A367KW96_RHIST|nr:carbon-nitrogen hydrolase [Gilbertella persicaria]KAI8069825.1 carbon-nitrogen hydrolase [Gilbertella persicaria]RCI06478.1 hypothetical protein CU098_013744 [Rhizopus stolonifer]
MTPYSHSIVCSFLIHINLLLTLFTEQFVLKHARNTLVRVLFFPLMYAGIWQLIYRFGGLGDFPSWTTHVVIWADFAQIASWGGRSLIDFVVALFGACLLELLPSKKTIREEVDEFAGEEEELPERVLHPWKAFLIHPMTLFCVLLAILLSYGGARVNIHAKSFYQVGYPDYIPQKQPVGCVIGSEELELQLQHDIWFNMTESLIESGAKLVLWSELTAAVKNEKEEDALIERARKVARERQVYLGITYALGDPTTANKLVFITKTGDIGINYNKAHPVPSVEPQSAGPEELQYVDTEDFGRVGGAICFDFSFPHFIQQASKQKVDLVLQPRPFGTYHENGNVLRTVENGFTRLRCSSQSISGVTEPTLNSVFTQRVASLNREKYIFYLPLQKHVKTLYRYIGDAFGYICLIISVSTVAMTFRKIQRERQVSLD